MARIAVNRRSRLPALILTGALLAGVAAVARTRYSTAARLQPKDAPAVATASSTGLPQLPPVTAEGLAEHLRKNPRDRKTRYQLAHMYFQSFDYARSLEELRILEKQDPRDPGVYLRRAVVLKSDGRPDAAEAAARKALSLQPANDQAELLLGDIHLDQRQYRRALTVFERHLRAQPQSVAALLGKSRALERLYLAQEPVKVDEMLAPVEKAAELAPNNPRVLASLAKMKFAYLTTPEDTAEAEAAALRAVQLDPQDSQPYVTLAQIYLARGSTPDNLQKVAEYAARAGTLNLNDPRPPYLIGRVALLQNDAPRATKALELSLKLGPMPETVLQLAAAHRRAGHSGLAEWYAGVYQRYMDLVARRDALKAKQQRQPKEVRHYHALARLYLDAGEPDKATGWLDQARRLRPHDPIGERLRLEARALRKKGQDAPLLRVP